jgi:TRAP-type uncharacterized transport system fused permease subunit
LAATLVLAAIVTIVLGLGMPTPSAYILAAVLVGPALVKVGLPVLESHMFLLYYAILSALTPPIAVAALAAAAIAEEDPFIIAFDAVRLAAVGFFMPFIFLWNPAILGSGNSVQILMVCLGGIVGAVAIAISFEWLHRGVIRWPLRFLLFAGAALAVSPNLMVAIIGILVCTVLSTWLLMQKFDQH